MKILPKYLLNFHPRKVIVWFALCLACVLFQTGEENIGTILSLVILFFFYFHFFKEIKIQTGGLQGVLFLFIIHIMLVSMIYSEDTKELFKFIIQALMCVCCMSINMTDSEFRFTKDMFVYFMCLNSGICIYSILNNPNGILIHDSIFMYGTFFDPNYVGIPFVAASVICLNEATINRRKLFFLPFVLFFTTIMITASRGSLVGFLIANGLFFLRLLNKRAKGAKLFLVIAIIAILFSYKNVYNNVFMSADNAAVLESRYEFEGADNGRFNLWGQGLQLFGEHPIFGKGLNGFYETYGHANHNTYMQVLTGTGFIGSVLFLVFILGVLKSSYRRDFCMFCMIMGLLAQITFLDTLSGRFLWPLFSLAVMAPNPKYINVNDIK